jgi:formylglycine-generating enzyme required for sulfatase activity
MKLPLRSLAVALASLTVVLPAAFAQVTISTVSVGDVGNANDSTGYGNVDYRYNIGVYEVTISQYTAFLNAVAKTDTYNLWNPSMGSDLNIAGISRSGLSGSYSYTVLGSGNRPVTYVSWFDAARFVNWLQNGQPVGAQGPGTTETGTYTLLGATSGVGFTRNATAIYSLPSENEWYKAAYYQPAAQGGDVDNYWLYPTRDNAIPNSRNAGNGGPTDPNSANFFRDDGIANGYNGGYAINNSLTAPAGNALMDVGTYSLASSYYGTFDQGGNVWEWTDGVSGSLRVIRGGSWSGSESTLRATTRSTFFPANENSIIGFRVVVPEPGVAGLLSTGLVLLALRRRRAR